MKKLSNYNKIIFIFFFFINLTHIAPVFAEHECFGKYTWVKIDLSHHQQFVTTDLDGYLKTHYHNKTIKNTDDFEIDTPTNFVQIHSANKIPITIKKWPRNKYTTIEIIEVLSVNNFKIVSKAHQNIIQKIAKYQLNDNLIEITFHYKRHFPITKLIFIAASDNEVALKSYQISSKRNLVNLCEKYEFL